MKAWDAKHPARARPGPLPTMNRERKMGGRLRGAGCYGRLRGQGCPVKRLPLREAKRVKSPVKVKEGEQSPIHHKYVCSVWSRAGSMWKHFTELTCCTTGLTAEEFFFYESGPRGDIVAFS